MKKILLALFLLPLLAYSYADWVDLEIDKRMTVSLPVNPEKKDLNGNETWVADVNSDARCLVVVVDFSRFGLDSAGVANEMGNEKSFEEFKTGLLGQIPDAKVISEVNTTYNGKRCFEFIVDMGKKDTSALNKMYNKNIFIGSKMYSFSFYEKNHSSQRVSKDKFFNSIRIK